MKKVFSMPTPMKITGRSSSITNAFANSIIPIIEPENSEIDHALSVLGMDRNSIACTYCGDKHSEWDHLRPLIVNKRPTGYISEINNLVPSCGKCNQSKGNKNWHSWMQSSANLSPKTRQVEGIDAKISHLKAYEDIGPVTKIDFIDILGEDLWDKHWSNWQDVIDTLTKSQGLAKEIKSLLAQGR